MNRKLLSVFLVSLLTFGLLFVSCDSDSGGGEDDGINQFAGTSWSGMDFDGDNCILTFTASRFTMQYPNNPSWNFGGAYTYKGNVATMTSDYGDKGTGTISGNTIRFAAAGMEPFTLQRRN